MGSNLISRNVVIDGRRTSLRLEIEMWQAFDEICELEGLTRNQLCAMIEARRSNSSRTSAVRAFVVTYLRVAAFDNEKRSRETNKRLRELVYD